MADGRFPTSLSYLPGLRLPAAPAGFPNSKGAEAEKGMLGCFTLSSTSSFALLSFMTRRDWQCRGCCILAPVGQNDKVVVEGTVPK